MKDKTHPQSERLTSRSNEALVLQQAYGPRRTIKLGDERIQYRAKPSNRAKRILEDRQCTGCGKKLSRLNTNLDDLCFSCQ